MRLVHLTDPHLSTLAEVNFKDLKGKRWSGYTSWRSKRQKKYLPEVLEKLSAAVKAEAADQILLTGDLIQIGLRCEIEQAADWLADLGPADQIMLVPGNHDVYARDSAAAVNHCWAEYLFQGCSRHRFPVMRTLGGLKLIGLSTATVSPIFMATGRLQAAQLEELSTMLEAAANAQQLSCLLIHHPPLPGMTSWRKSLSNAHALQDVLESYPPALIFHGHLHHNREYLWGNSRIYCTAAASSASDASYRVLDIEDAGDYWSLHMVLKSIAVEGSATPEFLVVDEQRWQVGKQAAVTATA